MDRRSGRQCRRQLRYARRVYPEGRAREEEGGSEGEAKGWEVGEGASDEEEEEGMRDASEDVGGWEAEGVSEGIGGWGERGWVGDDVSKEEVGVWVGDGISEGVTDWVVAESSEEACGAFEELTDGTSGKEVLD